MAAHPPAAVSCHVERPLDDRVWAAFSRLQASRPGGFSIAALMRPPDAEEHEDEARGLERARAARLVLGSGARLLELPSTHSLGMLGRGLAGRLEAPVVHVYFHDTDLLEPLRRRTLRAALAALGRLRARPTDLDALRQELADAPETPFDAAYEKAPA